VITKLEIAAPLFAGTTQWTFAEALAAMAEGVTGGPGTVAGVTPFEGAEAAPVPMAFVAVTVKV
jgi:hypothetical protein